MIATCIFSILFIKYLQKIKVLLNNVYEHFSNGLNLITNFK